METRSVHSRFTSRSALLHVTSGDEARSRKEKIVGHFDTSRRQFSTGSLNPLTTTVIGVDDKRSSERASPKQASTIGR